MLREGPGGEALNSRVGVVQRALERWGDFDLTVVDGGSEALRKLAEDDFDLLLLDFRLADMTATAEETATTSCRDEPNMAYSSKPAGAA